MDSRENKNNPNSIINNPFHLFSFPPEILNHIYKFSTKKSLHRFSETAKLAETSTAEQRFLDCILRFITQPNPYHYANDLANLQIILTSHPYLMFIKRFIPSANEKKIYMSPWQAAWYMGHEVLLKFMLGLVPIVEKGVVTAKEQYHQEFTSEKLIARTEQQLQLIKLDLAEIVDALKEDNCTYGKPTTQRLIIAFKSFMTHLTLINNMDAEKNIIKTGMYSLPEILSLAYQFYSAIYKRYQPISSERISWYSTQIISKTLQFAAPIDAQRYRVGLCFYFKKLPAPKSVDYTVTEFDPWCGTPMRTPSLDPRYLGGDYFSNAASEIKSYAEQKFLHLEAIKCQLEALSEENKPVVCTSKLD